MMKNGAPFFICLACLGLGLSNAGYGRIDHPTTDTVFKRKGRDTTVVLPSSSSHRDIRYKRPPAPPSVLFYHHSFKDFSKGRFSDAGGNLYVSKKGKIQFVNLFDLNFDGYPEVVINNDHNIYEAPDALVYHNRGGLHSLFNAYAPDAPAWQNFKWMQQSLSAITRLPTEGGGRSVVADLNLDGYKDVLFANFIHGSTLTEIPGYIYWGGPDGLNPLRRSLLPADRGISLAVDDITGDGLPDIVVANPGREHMNLETPEFSHEALDQLGGDREKTSYFFRQMEAGFTLAAREVIPTSFAVDVKIEDLDKDGKKELVFLELGEPGNLRIMGREGSKWITKQTLPVIAPKPLATGRRISQELLVKDLNGDGYADIFAPSLGERSEIFWNNRGRFSTGNRTVLETDNAMSADAADLNKDGLTDLVIASFFTKDRKGHPDFETDSYIWWGNKKGFQKTSRTAVPTLGAVSVRVADISGSGLPDIVFGQFRDRETLDVPSYIYLNSPDGFSAANRVALQGFGTVSVLADDLDEDGKKEVVLINSMSGKARHSGIEDGAGNDSVWAGGLPMYIYKGNAGRHYGPGNLIRVPQSSAETNLSFADMDDDGTADLVHLRGGGFRLTIRYDVYNYPATKNQLTEISIPFRANTVNVADFNKDGILDVLATPITGPQGLFCWGQGGHQYKTELFDFPHFAYSCSLGDVNNDGLLDAVTSSHKEICILKGRKEGKRFFFRPPEILTTDALTTRVSLADFNNDGWADLFCQNLQNTYTKVYDVQSWVVVNHQGSFSLDDKRSFASFGANGGTVAQLWKDGKLEVVLSNYHADASRRPGAFILKADASGFPSEENKIRLPAQSSGANMVLDFNGDGYQDVLVFNHTGNDIYNGGLTPGGGTHGVGSTLYWGSKNGFRPEDQTRVQSFGPHSRIMADPGSPGRRNPFETYTSAYLVNTTGDEVFRLTITGRFNNRQYVEAGILADNISARTPELLSRSDTVVVYRVRIPKNQRFRYTLQLNSSYSGSGPTVSSVKMEAERSGNNHAKLAHHEQ